ICHGQKLYKQIVNKEKNLQSRVTLEIFNIPRYWALTSVLKLSKQKTLYKVAYTEFLIIVI
ncbi:hypothetical protein, partial [Enterococcus cecorum]|uniref:hypothetical protein n=1 Tax=Enterococcus cecorum TaxID=44008 RepID=UPI002ACA912D